MENLLYLVILIADIWAIYSIIKSGAEMPMKIVWSLVVFLLPILHDLVLALAGVGRAQLVTQSILFFHLLLDVGLYGLTEQQRADRSPGGQRHLLFIALVIADVVSRRACGDSCDSPEFHPARNH